MASTQPAASAVYNPLGILGIEFIEFAGPNPADFEKTFRDFGFSRLKRHRSKAIDLYTQNDILFLVNLESSGFSSRFAGLHGQSASAMGLCVENAQRAFEGAVELGARPYEAADKSLNLPAVYGIGESLIYFIDAANPIFENDFVAHAEPFTVPDAGFLFIDHLTNNVEKGTMAEWAEFYKGIFGFTEIQYFDIKGKKTGLTSFALKSPCKTFSIPINEASDEKSQIAEYLRDYNGPGIQHIALGTTDLLNSLDRLEGRIPTLDIDENYYEEAFQRVPNVTEDKGHIMRHNVLIDGDDEGYLLQIFTKNLFGPIFIEMIQRKNHHAFGEGNFGALFKSIERDQERRGVL